MSAKYQLKPNPMKKLFFSRTSLFITCSGLYGIFLVVFCVSLLATEIATHSVPLHYFEVRQIQGCQKLYFINSNITSLVDDHFEFA